FVSNGMTFAQQEPSAKAPCTRTMVLIAMKLLLVSKACRLNVAVVHAGHYRTGTSVRPGKQRKTAQADSSRLVGAAGSAMSVTGQTRSLKVMSAARPLFYRNRKVDRRSAPTSLLADQQKRSHANQHRNHNTDDE